MRFPTRKGVMIVCLLAILQSVARFAIPIALYTQGGPELETPVSDDVLMFINAMFFALGGLGLLTAFGLWNERRWGFLGTMALSMVTIAFDVWAIIEVQWSAAMGIVLPTIFIVYLSIVRRDFQRQ